MTLHEDRSHIHARFSAMRCTSTDYTKAAAIAPMDTAVTPPVRHHSGQNAMMAYAGLMARRPHTPQRSLTRELTRARRIRGAAAFEAAHTLPPSRTQVGIFAKFIGR